MYYNIEVINNISTDLIVIDIFITIYCLLDASFVIFGGQKSLKILNISNQYFETIKNFQISRTLPLSAPYIDDVITYVQGGNNNQHEFFDYSTSIIK